MTRNQRAVHARTFSVLAPLLAALIALALVRAQRSGARLAAPTKVLVTAGSLP